MSLRVVARIVWLFVVASVLGAGWPSPEAIDEQRLRQAGLRLDSAELLDYLQPKAASPEQLAKLLQSLASDDYETRARAGRDLVHLGQPARTALEPLLKSHEPDVGRLARLLLDEIDTRLASPVTLSALRALCRLRHPKAATLVLEYLPHVDATARQSLAEALLRADPNDAGLRAALADPSAIRRANVGLMLARYGQPEHALPLLKDADPTVRLRTAQGFIGRGDERGLEPLIDLLTAPLDLAWQAEELLRWTAEASAPATPLGKGEAKARKIAQDAWRIWLAHPERKIDWAALRQSPRRPALYLICRGEKVELLGSDGAVRFTLDNSSAGGSIVDAHLMPDGKLLVFDDNEAELRLIDTAGKVSWKWKAPAGEIAQAIQILPSEGRIVAVTDEQVHELTLAGKHLSAMRSGDLFFSDACQIQPGRYAAVADEGFFLIDRTGRVLSKIPVPGVREDFGLDGGRLLPLGDGMFALVAQSLDRVIVYDASMVPYDGPLTGKPRTVNGLSRHRDGTWIVAQTQGPSLFRLAEQAPDGLVLREILLTQRPTRFRLVAEDLRAGLEDSPPGINIDSPEHRIAALRTGSLEARRRAATLLGQTKDSPERVVEPLIAALDSEDAILRTNASKSLAALGPVALPALLQTLRQGPERARTPAARGLGQLRIPAVAAVPALIDAATQPGGEVALRAAACEALGQIGAGANSAAATLRSAINATEPEIRQAAVVALGQVGQGEIENIRALVAVLDDRAEALAVSAVQSLARYGQKSRPALPDLVRLLAGPTGGGSLPSGALGRRKAALTALGEIGLEATADNGKTIAAIVTVFQGGKNELDLRQTALRTLTKLGPVARAALPAIREMLLIQGPPNEASQLSGEAMTLLRGMKQHGGLAVLIDVARGGSQNIRQMAISQIGSLGAEAHSAVGPLTEMLATEKNAQIRTAIQRTLKRIPMPPLA